MTTSPFAHADALETAFADGLASMLDSHSGLGVYILVLANAAYDADLWTRLAPALHARHTAHAEALTAALRHGQPLTEPEDDLMVFLKLNLLGFEHIERVQHRPLGHWLASFNPIRALRPPRNSGERFDTLLQPFDAAGFHFNKTFLSKEIFWQGTLSGKPARLLYNKFPFARLHGLLVPEPERPWPQMLTPELHGWAWECCATADVPGLRLGYNSLGAGASVNHLHFQSFVHAGLPVQHPRFTHNGGDEPYPLPCLRLNDAQTAWMQLDELHQRNQPYNLIYSREGGYLIARVPHDSAQLDAACKGYGWSEMAGVLNLFNRDNFNTLSADSFSAELSRFAP